MQKMLTIKLLMVVSIMAFIAGCGDKKEEIPANALSADPATLKWDAGVIGQLAGVKKVVISNTSDVEITGIDYKLEKNQSQIFLVGSDCTATLAPKATCNVEVNFKPDQSAKAYSDKYIFTYVTKTGDSTASIRLSGNSFVDNGLDSGVNDLTISGVTGSSPNFTLTKPLDSSVGVASEEGAITLKYIGSSAVSVRAVDNGTSDFSVRSACAGVLNNGQSCSMFFSYLPAVEGAEETIFKIIATVDGAAPIEINLKVKGNASAPLAEGDLTLTLDNQAAFTSTPVGQINQTAKTATLTNNTDSTLYFRAISTSGAFPVTFDTCTGVLNSGENCTLKTSFSPSKPYLDSAYIRVVAGTKATYAKVSGEGTLGGEVFSGVEISSKQLDFPQTELGFQSATKRITFKAQADNKIVTFNISPNNKSQVYRYTTNCLTDTALKNGESCSVDISYVPANMDNDDAQLNVKINTSGNSDTKGINLKGTPKERNVGNLETPIPGVTVSTKRYAYPDTALGLTSLFTFTVTNNGSEAVTGFRSTSTDLINFPLDKEFTKCGSTIPAGGDCTISYRFIARSTPIKTAYISLWADGVEPDNQIIEISGKGTLFNRYLNFGYVKDAPKVLSMAYVNDTQDAQNITDITVKSLATKWDWKNTESKTHDQFKATNFSEEKIDTNPPFTMLSNDCTGRVLVNQDSCIIRIQFDPANANLQDVTAYRARILLQNNNGTLKNGDKIVGQFHATASTEESRIMYFPTDSETSGEPIFVGPKARPDHPASQAQIDATTAVIGENYYIYGGMSDYSDAPSGGSRDWSRDPNVGKLRVYDAARNMWKTLKPSGKSPLETYGKNTLAVAAAAVVNSKLYLFGGSHRTNGNDTSLSTNDVFVYDPSNIYNSPDGAWSKLATRGTTPRQKQGASATSLGGHLFIFGGYPLTNEFHALDLRDPASPTWITIPATGGTVPRARSNAAMVAYNDKIYLHGGNDSGAGEANDLWEYTPIFDESGSLTNKGTWKLIYEGDGMAEAVDKDMLRPSTRVKHSMSVVNGKLIIAGQGFIWPNTAVNEFKKHYFYVYPDKGENTADILKIFELFKVTGVDDLNKLGREAEGMIAGHYSAAIEGVFWFYNVNIMGLFMDKR